MTSSVRFIISEWAGKTISPEELLRLLSILARECEPLPVTLEFCDGFFFLGVLNFAIQPSDYHFFPISFKAAETGDSGKVKSPLLYKFEDDIRRLSQQERGRPGAARTLNQRIKSPLLHRDRVKRK